MKPLSVYPEPPSDRSRWIEKRRGAKNAVSSQSAYATVFEEEPGPDGTLWRTATIFLTNRECPFRCLMCDLWKNTLDEPLAPGAIPRQIATALEAMPPARAVKLYNSGSYFDPRAIPPEDDLAVAELVRGFQRTIVESHTAFLSGAHRERVLRFAEAIRPAALEIAVGLETAHPGVLERLNKRTTLEQFRAAAEFLRESEIALRTFVLVRPPFLTEGEALFWAKRSLDEAHSAGASFVALIPVRGGNGAMEELLASGDWAPPSLKTVEAALVYGQGLAPGTMRVTADLWDIQLFAREPGDIERIERIARRNTSQGVRDADALQ